MYFVEILPYNIGESHYTMRILVTGGAGFIGSHLVEKLLSLGDEVVCFDNFDSFYDPQIKHRNIAQAKLSPHYTLIEGDVRNKGMLQSCFEKYKFDVVVHLAAKAGVRSSLQRPEEYYEVNITGTLNLLETMRKFSVKNMIFASSSSVYGNNVNSPFSETDNVDHPISPYAATKKAGELLCYTYHHLYDFSVFCLRFFTVYGPRQRPEMAIHTFVRNIIERNPITLYGNGNSMRDYTYVDDIVDGIVNSINRLKGYEVINLGESQTFKLLDLVHVIEEAVGQKAIIQWKPAQPGDVDKTFADITKAKHLLGYAPHVGIVEGVRQLVEWWLAVIDRR